MASEASRPVRAPYSLQVRVGTELKEMTKTEFRELRLEQLRYSTKNNNVYRMIYQIVHKGEKKKKN